MNIKAAIKNDFQIQSDEATQWLLDSALPIWFERGIDRVFGGFHDFLDMHTGMPLAGIKRAFVQARQVYVFAEAHALQNSERWLSAISQGLNILAGPLKHPEWGCMTSLGLENLPHQTGRRLYDQSFDVLGHAMSTKACASYSERIEGLKVARDKLALIIANWRLSCGGMQELDLLNSHVRLQNPFMHLFEASLAIALLSKEKTDIDQATDMAEFAINHFVDQETGCIAEQFTIDWEPVKDNGHFIIEPGHQFEWAWLLCRLDQVSGSGYRSVAEKMWRYASKHGVDRHRGVAVDEIASDGHVVKGSARLWPQAERLKAALVMAEYHVAGAEAEVRESYFGLSLYLKAPIAGLYFDKLLEDGAFVDEPARASSLYHIVCAISELRRVNSSGFKDYEMQWRKSGA